MRVLLAILLVIVFAAAGSAQNSKLITRDVNDFDKIVRGAPFSALAILEGVQVLADGTTITRRATRKLYRDNDGRLRRDESRSQLGIPGANIEIPESIEILDPVGGYKYQINSKDQTVFQTWLGDSPEFKYAIKQTEIAIKQAERMEKEKDRDERVAKNAARREEVRSAKPAPAAGAVNGKPASPGARSDSNSNQTSSVSVGVSASSSSIANSKPTPPVDPKPNPNGNSRTESLGMREIEGVKTEGTRTTTTIEAGAIGNDREIIVVYEKWYSKELQMTILSTHRDPRFGEQTYRLTNVRRNDQPISVFQPPTGFKLMGVKGVKPKPAGSPPKPADQPQKPAGPSVLKSVPNQPKPGI